MAGGGGTEGAHGGQSEQGFIPRRAPCFVCQDRHSVLGARAPKMLLPTRTDVLPQAMADSKSPDMPIDSCRVSAGTPHVVATSLRHATRLCKRGKGGFNSAEATHEEHSTMQTEPEHGAGAAVGDVESAASCTHLEEGRGVLARGADGHESLQKQRGALLRDVRSKGRGL
mgnify:CR=1 FL=1